MSRLDEYEARRALDGKRKRRGHQRQISADVYEAKIDGQPCRVCGSGGRMEAHHLVHRGRWSKGVEGLHSADNLIPLCHPCHQDHHTTTHRVPLGALTDSEAAFVLEHAGEGWASKWYPAAKRLVHRECGNPPSECDCPGSLTRPLRCEVR